MGPPTSQRTAHPPTPTLPHQNHTPNNQLPEPLSSLPALVTLDAGSNPIPHILPSGPWPALADLRLGGCGVADWASVAALARLPALAAVRLTGHALPRPCPSAGGDRTDLVARLPPGVTRLNGAAITARSRLSGARASRAVDPGTRGEVCRASAPASTSSGDGVP